MNRYDLDCEIVDGYARAGMYERRHGDWIKAEYADDLLQQIHDLEAEVSQLESQLETAEMHLADARELIYKYEED